MSLFTHIKTKLASVFSKTPPPVVEVPPHTEPQTKPTWKNMCLSPDGAWLDTQNQASENSTPDQNTPSHVVVSLREDIVGPLFMVVSRPPPFYPHQEDLHFKLEQCLELGIITNCVHKSSGTVYILDIELPGTGDRGKDLKKLKLFIEVMQKQYKLIIVQQNAINKLTAPGVFYRTVFEYKEEIEHVG